MGFIHVSPALSSICLGIFIVQLLVLGDRVEMSTRQMWGFGLMAMALLWNFVCLFDSVSMGWFSQAFVSDRAAADLQKLAWVKMQVKLKQKDDELKTLIDDVESLIMELERENFMLRARVQRLEEELDNALGKR